MTNQPTADWLVADARRAVHEALIVLPAPEADRVRSLIADLETAVEARTAMRVPAVPVSSPPPSRPEPETPLEKRLRYSERRNDELRTECKRRGKRVLEQSEKIIALEKQLDEVRAQLGAEILRAGQAEAELRRLAAEVQQPDTETQACAHPDGCDGECPCPPSCGCCTVTAAPGTETPNTARAAVYREVADRLTTDAHGMQPDWARIYKRDAANKVREWAEQLDGEGRQDDTTPRPVQHAPGNAVLCPNCRTKGHAVCMDDEQPPAHVDGNADDCPACQAQGLHTIGHPYECPGSEK